MDSLPVVDFSCQDKDKLAKEIVGVMETVGFLYLDNVAGYDAQVEQELLDKNKWFFNLSRERKMKIARYLYNKNNRNIYRGYFGLDDNYTSYKEGLEIGQDTSSWSPEEIAEGRPLTEATVWPEPEETDSEEEKEKYIQLKETMSRHYRNVMNASVEFIQLISMGLGLPKNYLDQLFVKSLSTLRLQHYPLRDAATPTIAVEEDGQAVVCGAHADSVFVTFLSTFHYAGLQVLLPDNTWLNVAPRPGSFVVNLGKTLSNITGGRIKATKHRVIETGVDRYSLPFFLEPGFKAMIPLSLPLAGESETMEYVQYGPWLMESMKIYAESGDLLQLVAECDAHHKSENI